MSYKFTLQVKGWSVERLLCDLYELYIEGAGILIKNYTLTFKTNPTFSKKKKTEFIILRFALTCGILQSILESGAAGFFKW